MANSFGSDILIQVPDPHKAADFYVKEHGFEITSESPMIELKGPNINLYIDLGPQLGPILEVFVPSVEAARDRLVLSGCTVLREEPDVPRCYVRDPFGLIYNLTCGSPLRRLRQCGHLDSFRSSRLPNVTCLLQLIPGTLPDVPALSVRAQGRK